MVPFQPRKGLEERGVARHRNQLAAAMARHPGIHNMAFI